ncbi:hypothetical protein K6119_04970 [Paracrocinitomix mangrovi]|uniref:DUF7793 family protein n=1 Tax=Paracrocinitomix mangrovi TaxID=2862509 RepID=UPI001EDB6BF0|nr:hypothetical protein [Paracrocinitomix mangrovi]UKN02865.1 hypothetical protein K6119_04970 [Paracrocinitomix mangrovi]
MIKLKTGEQYLDEEGRLHIKFNIPDKNEEFRYADAKEHIEASLSLCEGIARPFIIDGNDANLNMTPEACKLLATDSSLNSVRLAEAFITDSLAVNLMFQYHIRLRKSPPNSKIFKNNTEAEEWLNDIVAK